MLFSFLWAVRLHWLAINIASVFHTLEDGSEETILPAGDFASNEPIILSPALSPDGNHVVFSDVTTKAGNGTFVYEGFLMDLGLCENQVVREHHYL
ncbi:hypothetical protein [Lentibacillus halodurans]|uniref:hypothetical protein n=1 Tax=Lentibacillus halodurans TaxID=237679 RepID=UPI000B7ED638|nr:hypothetical protein [Lentibacillus halodurans]